MSARQFAVFACLFSLAATAQVPQQMAQQAADPPAMIDVDRFQAQTAAALKLRAQRTVDVARFVELMREPGTLLLDTRSKAAYTRKHLKGAVHLNFSDFTAGKLARVIGSKDRKVLIYCNNNIANDPVDFAAKSTGLALNIPTFINLHGYGYTNVYELGRLVRTDDPRLVFEGTAVRR